MSGVGVPVSSGRTSELFAWGVGSVVKVPRPGVPPHWARVEAEIADAVHRAGVPSPEVRGLVVVDGRESIVFERIDGPSVWDLMRDRPSSIRELAAVLAELQRAVQAVPPPAALPRFGDRLVSKVLDAGALTADARSEAAELAAALVAGAPSPPVLCHGDLHPANVLMAPGGRPMAIDWFDAAIGPAEADLVRTSLLIRPPQRGRAVATHLPGGRPEDLDRLHRSYLEAACAGLPACRHPELLAWERALAAARLSEHTTADRGDLVDLWQGPGPSPLQRFLERRVVRAEGI